MVPCDTLTPRALRVTAHAICQWVLVRFELAIFGSQAKRSNHYTSVAAYILQCYNLTIYPMPNAKRLKQTHKITSR